MSTIKTIPLAELIEDGAIYPRHAVDDHHVTQLAYALKSGATLPPVVAEATSKRIVDGWHRTRAARHVFGPNGRIEVDLRTYAGERELLEDAVGLNAHHGRKLDSQDRTRAINMLEGVGTQPLRIQAILSLPEAQYVKLRVRTAVSPIPIPDVIPGTNRVPIKIVGRHLEGTTLTTEQATAHASLPGTPPQLHIAQLRKFLESGMVNRQDSKLVASLRTLYTVLGAYLSTVAEAIAS